MTKNPFTPKEVLESGYFPEFNSEKVWNAISQNTKQNAKTWLWAAAAMWLLSIGTTWWYSNSLKPTEMVQVTKTNQTLSNGLYTEEIELYATYHSNEEL